MSELNELQRAFTGHLRDPDHVPIPSGLDARRVGVYRDLIFNNLSSLLQDMFPVMRSVLEDSQWDAMVRDFFVTHQSQTPYFPMIAGEFAEYLAHAQLATTLPGFVPELAHYEWLELALYIMEESPPAAPLDPDSLADTPLALSGLAMPLAYDYPVHRIRPEFVPTAPSDAPHCLLMLRDDSDAVRFFELAPLGYHMLRQIVEQPGLVPREWLGEALREAPADQRDDLMAKGIHLLTSFNEHKVFIDTRTQ